jgi:hypothetical protein
VWWRCSWVVVCSCLTQACSPTPTEQHPLLLLLLLLLRLTATQYSLPASFDVLPLMARMTAGVVQRATKGAAAVVLITLHWQVPRELRLPPKGEEAAVAATAARASQQLYRPAPVTTACSAHRVLTVMPPCCSAASLPLSLCRPGH